MSLNVLLVCCPVGANFRRCKSHKEQISALIHDLLILNWLFCLYLVIVRGGPLARLFLKTKTIELDDLALIADYLGVLTWPRCCVCVPTGMCVLSDDQGHVIDLVKDELPELKLSDQDRQKNLELLEEAKKVSDRFLTRRGRRSTSSLTDSPTGNTKPRHTVLTSNFPCFLALMT